MKQAYQRHSCRQGRSRTSLALPNPLSIPACIQQLSPELLTPPQQRCVTQHDRGAMNLACHMISATRNHRYLVSTYSQTCKSTTIHLTVLHRLAQELRLAKACTRNKSWRRQQIHVLHIHSSLPRTLTAVSVHLQDAQPTAILTLMALHLLRTQQTVGCSMQQCQVSAYLDIIQMVNVELGDGSAPNCNINGLGGWRIRLHQHHSQILVHLQMHKLIHTCVFRPECLMSHDWLHTPDCKV